MQTSPEPAGPGPAGPEPSSPESSSPESGSPGPAARDARSQELAANLDAVHARIDRAMAAVGRQDRPELIVVTKFFPAADVLRLYRLGVRDVGENRDQEAAAKAAEVAQLLLGDAGASTAVDSAAGDSVAATGRGSAPAQDGLHWHFIGQLQSNKARSVIDYADHLHSVDRASLLKALVKAAPARDGLPLTCLIQVDLRDPVPTDGRGGADPAQIPELAERIAEAPGLQLGGLMAVAPLHQDPAPAFRRLAELSAQLRLAHPEARMISAGMSGDLEEAVAHGATHLRVGRDVLGERPLQR
ncbi:YggS family pyridoxal phosphate enzyme [Nesterenkonia sp. E16_7]|uniref:alanine racemase n=1 Tax=unclassified Nesterenkonia TaxID=2629769 RepID=UPI001A90FED2|nr:YggS family pyridoxal phosphate enzyme [Nesterenkonia sp. E16_10]MBO0598767.1 YggS family pyridoxal phosphate enzyme [Nesterenkonia sp. E16_7]